MLAAARDQENLTHAHQTVAAAKHLNQETKGVKTPANKSHKTPFGVPVNDENAFLQTGKSVLQTNGKNLNFLAKNGKQGKEGGNDGYITPAGPRNRAPLGAKTTNAKAKAFQTPAPLSIDQSKEKSTLKSLTPRMRRAKVKVHQAEPSKIEVQDEEPEIEYMPPQPKPLRDDPDDFPADKEYPMFAPENITRGMYSVYSGADDEDFIAKREKEEAEAQVKHDKAMDDLLQKAIDDDPIIGRDNIFEKRRAEPRSKGTSTTKTQTAATAKGPSLSISKSAATALARPTASTAQKAKPPISKLPTAPSAMSKSKTTRPLRNPAPVPAPSRNAAASRSTLGYAHGRAASATLRRAETDETSKKMHNSARAASAQNANAQPARTAGLAAASDEAAELDALMESLGVGRAVEDDGDDCAAMEAELFGGLPEVEAMWREEAMQEFRMELPEAF